MSFTMNLLMNLFPTELSLSNINLHYQSATESTQDKLYQELGLEHLHQRWWMRQLCLFYKVFHNKVPKYVHGLIPSMRTSAM